MPRSALILVPMILAACGGSTPASSYVMSRFNWGQVESSPDNIAPGFDLDGAVTESGGSTGCGRRDFVGSAPESEPGVDNQLAVLLQAAPQVVFNGIDDAVEGGELVLLVRLTAMESTTTDDEVTVELLRGRVAGGAIELDGDGAIAADQTFEIEAASLDGTTALATATGTLDDGRLDAAGFSFSFTLPMDQETMNVGLETGHIRFTVGEDGLTNGILGGSLSLDDALVAGTALGFPAADVRPILEGTADLEPNSDGECTRMSGSFVFSGAGATLGATY